MQRQSRVAWFTPQLYRGVTMMGRSSPIQKESWFIFQGISIFKFDGKNNGNS